MIEHNDGDTIVVNVENSQSRNSYPLAWYFPGDEQLDGWGRASALTSWKKFQYRFTVVANLRLVSLYFDMGVQ